MVEQGNDVTLFSGALFREQAEADGVGLSLCHWNDFMSQFHRSNVLKSATRYGVKPCPITLLRIVFLK
ncbi:hypothetical protein D5074_00370 [Pectobacterium polaris]|nr:hypothetical protein D5074_00370 [Pectobacterium polaris]